MLINISPAMTCYLANHFGLTPCPSHASLWSANTIKWKAANVQRLGEATIFCLTDKGALIKLQARGKKLYQSSEKWEEWAAEVGEIGTLVMIMAGLCPLL